MGIEASRVSCPKELLRPKHVMYTVRGPQAVDDPYCWRDIGPGILSLIRCFQNFKDLVR